MMEEDERVHSKKDYMNERNKTYKSKRKKN